MEKGSLGERVPIMRGLNWYKESKKCEIGEELALASLLSRQAYLEGHRCRNCHIVQVSYPELVDS